MQQLITRLLLVV